MKRSPGFVTTIAMAFALGLSTVFALSNASLATQTPECPTDTTFIAKYDLPNLDTPSEGSDVITFSDLQGAGNELKRFDFVSNVPISYVYVKAGSDPSDSGNYDYRSSPVTSGNDLLTPTGKGVSHISFCGPLAPTTGTIIVTKYNDLNGNGTRDSSEPTLPGWSFAVETASGRAAGTITTGASGSGTLSDLVPGDYSVSETTKSGWTNTDPAGASPAKTATVVAGQTSNLVFGNQALPTTGAITVTKYEDVNGNGARDEGEPLLPGWSFAVHPVEGTPLGPIVTGTSGSGTLSGLTPGAYSVVETLQQGWESMDPADGTLTKSATVVAGQTSNLLFGNRAVPATGAIIVTKYNDLNGNGSRDQGEPALEGWTFRLHDGVEVTFAELSTGTDGSVTFSGLEPRTYYVSETMKSGWTNTDPAGASPSKTATVVAGQTSNLVFGNQALPTMGAISVTKYNDLDRDGVQDQGEPLLDGWSFAVQNAAGASAGTITTGTSGAGTLSGLAPGEYSVVESPQTNWHNTDPGGGLPTKTATVVAGQTAPLVFGNYYAAPQPPPPPPPVPGTLTVVKYHDVDRDGVLDQGEPLLSGWTFSVMSGNAIVHTLVTGQDGSASVTLNEGTYSVLETQQLLWTSTDPGAPAPSKVAQIRPGSATTLLFGNAHVLLPPTSETVLAIVKYHDANLNRVRESTEALLAGFTFIIRDERGAMVGMVTTDDSGMAVVTNLPLGVYTIVEQARTGWYNTDPGGAATQSALLTENALGATVIFGNATVILPSTAQLPSTSTEEGTTGAVVAVIVGLAIVTAIGFGSLRFRIR